MEAVNHDHTNATTQRTLLGSPRSLVRDWCSPWPGKLRTGKLPLVHFAAFDPALFARHDASTAQARGLGWSDSLSSSVPQRRGILLRSLGRALPCGKAAYLAALWVVARTRALVAGPDSRQHYAHRWPSGRRHRQQFKLSTYRSGPRATCSWRSTTGTARQSSTEEASIAGVIERRSPGPLGDHRLQREGELLQGRLPHRRQILRLLSRASRFGESGVGRLLLEVVEPLDETFVAGSRWPVDFGVFCDFVVLTAVLEEARPPAGTNNLQSCDVGAGNHRGIHHVPARSGGPLALSSSLV